MGHHHTHHDHDHDNDHNELKKSSSLPLSLWGQLMRPHQTVVNGRTDGKIIIAALMVLIPAIFRKRLTRMDFGIFAAIAASLSVFDTLRLATKQWIARVKTFQENLGKHSTPLTRKYFFKNDNAADRITLLGVYVNILLSVSKFAGGIGKRIVIYKFYDVCQLSTELNIRPRLDVLPVCSILHTSILNGSYFVC
jgi:hypothetical protein